MARSRRGAPTGEATADAKVYRHKQETPARPDAGAAPRFRARKKPATWRYDSSLSPALDWDEAPAREVAAWLLSCIGEAAPLEGQVFPQPRVLTGADGRELMRVAGLQDALAALKRMQAPFLNWAGKAERLSFDVPTLPLFVHERLSTEAIVRTLDGHRKAPAAEQEDLPGLFGDPQLPMAKQVDAYAYKGGWVNRMILGDSLSVMNSLVRYEGLGGQVQMIYMDPPYGVKFGSNFQPFVRKRDVKHGDDADMTREPEMVQAYRDTWELGLHSYLAYMRDRLTVARELLAPSGSVFVQISDENVHHVREVMDEVFKPEDFCGLINFAKTTGAGSPSGGTDLLPQTTDYLLWYAKDRKQVKFKQLYLKREPGGAGASQYNWLDVNGSRRRAAPDEVESPPKGARIFAHDNLTAQSAGETTVFGFELEGRIYRPGKGGWKTNQDGMQKLSDANRLMAIGNTLRYIRYFEDFPLIRILDRWADTVISGFGSEKLYVVQTHPKVIERCILMTTDPGDLVLDPTCGSGTTAYVAEQWGRRWITVDTSRVPLALARQRLLTASFPWHRLKDAAAGPAGGFVYARRQNSKGEEVGGIVPHITLKSIANDAPPAEEVLVDRPEQDAGVTRVTGPFAVEAVIPTPQALDEDAPQPPQDAPSDHIARMIEVLRRSPALRLPNGGAVTLKSVRRPAKSLNLSAEALVENGTDRPVAIVFGPPNGAVGARAVLDAAKEANVKGFSHLYVIGFLFTAEARAEIDAGEAALGLAASAVQVTLDILMGDLLKTQRSSQIFAITGSPEIEVNRLPDAAGDGTPRWQARLLGLDTFDPEKITPHHLNGDDVPMWMLDTGWNGMAFSADQVFFPRTKAWENLRKTLKTTHDDSVWAHLAGDTSAPFAAPAGTDIAVKVLDDRGNELLKTHRLGAPG